MNSVKEILAQLLAQTPSESLIFKRNILKEYFQVVILDFIYSHRDYGRMFFYGGSCLSHCYGLPRLSEDLDFVDAAGKIKISELARDLEMYLNKDSGFKVKTSIQKFRIYLKFPILKQLGLAGSAESDLLFLKVEVFNDFHFCRSYQTQIIPLFKFNRSVLIRTFDLPTLMATKIRAVLWRKWEKTDKQGNILAKVKGRDYYDLMWYLQKNIRPNLKCVETVINIQDLKEKLLTATKRADGKSIREDLLPLIADRDFVSNLSRNIKSILTGEISKLDDQL